MAHTNPSYISDSDVASNGKSKSKTDLIEDEEEDLRCGYGSCKPSWLQVFNNPKVFLVWLCYFSFIQGFVVNGINNVNVTAVERRFNLPSTQVGLVSSAYDFSCGVLAIPLSYLGTYGNQPRILTIAALVMSLGSFIMTIPHFTTGIYELGTKEAETCISVDNSTLCESEDTSLQNYLYVLILGQVLHGVGGQTLYCLGVVFIDANVPTRSSPIYQGIMFAGSTVGPAVGYLLGGVFLDIYTDFHVVDVDSLSVDPDDPRWVGAWWLGFLAGGCLALVIVVALAPYAHMLPSSRVVQAERISECHQNGCEDKASQESFGRSIKDIPKMIWMFLTNPVLVFTTAGSVTEGLLTAGFATFLPKFVQNQFTITPGAAAVLTGFITIPAAAGGTLFGALICRCFKLRVRGMLRFLVFLTVTSGLLCFLFLVKCTPLPFAGITVPYFHNGNSDPAILDTVDVAENCNNNCGCSQNSYTPICGIDNIQYFSACHAGCTDESKNAEDTPIYFNCSCVVHNATIDLSEPDATGGVCDGDCSTAKVMYPFLFALIFITLAGTVPVANTTIRCVPDNMRAMSFGLQWVFARFLGNVPGPILFGVAFDKACVVWREKCEEQGSCWIYDSDKLNVNLTILGVVVRSFSVLFFSIALFTYKPPKETVPAVVAERSTGGDELAAHNNKASTPDEDNGEIDADTRF